MKTLLLLLVLLVCSCEGMFGKGSAVQELTPKTIGKFMSGHKPAMLLLYAPWCGHCKSIHPEFEKLAKSVKGIVKIGAVDADKYKEIGGQYQVKGFPTIKTFAMTDKKSKTPLDYQQERSFKAMKATALSLVSSKNVKKPTKTADITSKPHVILFTKKKASPPLFSVVSASPKLKEKYTFYMITESNKLKDAYAPPTWPSVGIFVEGEEPKYLEMEKGVEYQKLAEFILGDESKKE
eukprot:TRINITY_DN34524_c0_g1_i1.p1 TRINITY_DN34524_c0_g1~~TRINITY_DN34524_c0_g1_i1.p1  ORF type:complete len:236 (+),score=77.62 TRINITY_DN34524_c0_g1_i1:51-758(+)